MKQRDSLSDFKHHNGFLKIDIPRYYVPLTTKGEIALKLNLHLGVAKLLPENMVIFLKDMRRKWYENKLTEEKTKGKSQ